MKQECGALTPKLEKLVHILDWVRIEEWTVHAWQGIGRKPHDRSALANAFVAKAVLGLATTRALIERLAMDRSLKRLCGFSMTKVVPDEATFSRAFAEFAQAKLAERVHEALVKDHLGGALI
ncbi:IS5/IS1182 family transposase, partial [Massilia sp. CCM 8733]|nr:IS5/IS1182 family transposase [Massilia mucilaginosa]